MHPAVLNLINQKDFTNLLIYLECVADDTEKLHILDEIMRLRFCGDPEIRCTNVYESCELLTEEELNMIDNIIPIYSALVFGY